MATAVLSPIDRCPLQVQINKVSNHLIEVEDTPRSTGSSSQQTIENSYSILSTPFSNTLNNNQIIDIEETFTGNPAFRDTLPDGYSEKPPISSFTCGVRKATLTSLRDLLNMYKVQVDERISPLHTEGLPGPSALDGVSGTVLSGGLQQYINQNPIVPNEDELESVETQNKSFFSSLPDDLHLQIFSYLSAKDLCTISSVSTRWLTLSSDNVLWQKKLDYDMYTWHVISHTTNPHMYSECQSDYTSKEIYLRCSPLVNRMMRQQNYGFLQLSNILRSLLPKKISRIAMFGPGLEMSTSAIVRKILQDKTGLFNATGMFPGRFDGVGSGFTMRMENGETFNLMALYTSTRHEREAARQNPGQMVNRMMQAQAAEEGEANMEPKYELRPAIRELAHTLDALVFVVDASANSVSDGYPEFKAMINELWTMPGIPVLVLSCVPEYNSKRLSCIKVVEQLHLAALNRPWQVYDCVVESLAGVSQAFTWLVQQAQRT